MGERSFGRKVMAPVVGAVVLGVAVMAGIHGARSGSQGGAEAGPPRTAAARLLADIQRYRDESARLAPEEAAMQWFALFERAATVNQDFDSHDYAAIDALTGTRVSQLSLFAALPPPDAWQAFRAEAARRAQASKAPRSTLGIRYLGEVLAGDRAAARATLDSLDEAHVEQAATARELLTRVYGDASTQLAEFEANLRQPAGEYDEFAELSVPDLVDIAGDRAEGLMLAALETTRPVRIQGSEPTRQLARRVALANLSRLKIAQWSLADSVDASKLYEGMNQRFGKPSSESPGQGWRWQQATQYYFLAMVIEGKQAAAERALAGISEQGKDIYIPRAAIEALQRARMNEQLYRFLDGLLQRRPDVPAWGLYIEQAGYTGHAREALTRLEATLSRADLSTAQRSRLQSWRFGALLSADRIDPAETQAAEMFALPLEEVVEGLDERMEAASKAMLAGRLLARPKMSQPAEAFARAILALPPQNDRGAANQARSTLYAELRRTGRTEEALALAVNHVDRKIDSFGEAVTRRMGMNMGNGDQQALVEVVSIYSQTGRHDKALEALETAPHWAADDVAQLMDTKDSLGVPLPVIVARTLAAKADDAAALRVARATVRALPGEDAGYELIAKLDPEAGKAFDELFALDPFEERPLIWKASLQLANRQLDAAEATIRQAIAIDPSDGEEGPNDRMRAYAVLSRILDAQGDQADAGLYANAVAAIRLSEQGDRFHEAGLYERAFATYRAALEKFSDAYCIQSRLAVQLNKQGRRQEALAHYRRAYELMPSSFGRVESHCFGCESVFEGPDAQTLAERVFTDILRKTPEKPQAHYLLAYLREHQGRYAEAVQPLRAAVSLDPQYLNAWKKLDGIAGETYIEAGERDIARLKLLELDPMQRHAHHSLEEVGDLRGLWSGALEAEAVRRQLSPPAAGVYPLKASAKLRADAAAQGTPEARYWRELANDEQSSLDPHAVMYKHALIQNAQWLTLRFAEHDE